MMLSLIWAMTDDGVIGIENRLPWHLPADMRWFRQHTLGKPIIMGRKTFESFGGKPLPERPNFVVSRDPDYRATGCSVAASLEAAIELNKNEKEVMIIGGANIYAQALALADRLYMTLVHANIKGDAFFPKIDLNEWQEIERQDHPADEKNPHPYSFCILERVSKA